MEASPSHQRRVAGIWMNHNANSSRTVRMTLHGIVPVVHVYCFDWWCVFETVEIGQISILNHTKCEHSLRHNVSIDMPWISNANSILKYFVYTIDQKEECFNGNRVIKTNLFRVFVPIIFYNEIKSGQNWLLWIWNEENVQFHTENNGNDHSCKRSDTYETTMLPMLLLIIKWYILCGNKKVIKLSLFSCSRLSYCFSIWRPLSFSHQYIVLAANH